MIQHSVALLVRLEVAIKGRETHGSVPNSGDLRAILAEFSSGLLSSHGHWNVECVFVV